MEIVLIGLNHRTATVELRERVAFSVQQACEAADQLRSRGILEETLVLSTCNRSELYGVPRELAATPCYWAKRKSWDKCAKPTGSRSTTAPQVRYSTECFRARSRWVSAFVTRRRLAR